MQTINQAARILVDALGNSNKRQVSAALEQAHLNANNFRFPADERRQWDLIVALLTRELEQF